MMLGLRQRLPFKVDHCTPSPSQVYLADWLTTQVAVKVLLMGQVANASDAQRALSLSTPIMQRLEAEASLLASLRWAACLFLERHQFANFSLSLQSCLI